LGVWTSWTRSRKVISRKTMQQKLH
jgi:hypothetical protein